MPLYNIRIIQGYSSFCHTYSLKLHFQLHPISISIGVIVYNIHQSIKLAHVISYIIICSKLIYGFCKSSSTQILTNNGIYCFYLTMEWLSIFKPIHLFSNIKDWCVRFCINNKNNPHNSIK